LPQRPCDNPKKEHGKLVKHLGMYLLGTRDKGIIYDPDPKASFECYVDASFAGDWVSEIDQAEDPGSARSRTGYVIQYHGCPILWASKRQDVSCMSSTESEIYALSAAAREILPLTWLLQEMHDNKLIPQVDAPKVHCKIFEDNAGCITIAKFPKVRARTKHIHTKYFFFRELIGKVLSIHYVSTQDQRGNYLTKNLNYTLLSRHRKSVQGW